MKKVNSNVESQEIGPKRNEQVQRLQNGHQKHQMSPKMPLIDVSYNANQVQKLSKQSNVKASSEHSHYHFHLKMENSPTIESVVSLSPIREECKNQPIESNDPAPSPNDISDGSAASNDTIANVIFEDDLFFIYDHHHISGPFDHSEIIRKFIRNEISNKIWVKSVKDAEEDAKSSLQDSNNQNWYVINLPVDANSDTDDNRALKNKFPKLYGYLIDPNLKQYKKPVGFPEGAASVSIGTTIIQIAGIFVWVVSCMILCFHVACTVPISVGYYYSPCHSRSDTLAVSKQRFQSLLIASF